MVVDGVKYFLEDSKYQFVVGGHSSNLWPESTRLTISENLSRVSRPRIIWSLVFITSYISISGHIT